jgi:deoxycytidine triphosphate deaminase
MNEDKNHGAVLGDTELRKRLDKKEIFCDRTWVPENLRSAGYDLRIADDFLIVPDADYPGGRRYERGVKCKDSVVMRPGDVAFVSTMEKMCIPWDLAGNIGIRFGFAHKGVLILTGLLVDPGFGLKKNGDKWVPKEDERLHFLLANVGAKEFVFKAGDHIAQIQFFQVIGEVKKLEVPSTLELEQEFFSNAQSRLGPLSFFRNLAALEQRFSQFDTRFEAVESGTRQVVMFGIYLLGASVLVAAFAAFLSLISSQTFSSRLDILSHMTWAGSLTLLAISVAFCGLCWLIVKLLSLKLVSAKPGQRHAEVENTGSRGG